MGSVVMDLFSNDVNTFVHFDPLYSFENLTHPEKSECLKLSLKKQPMMMLLGGNASEFSGGYSKFMEEVRNISDRKKIDYESKKKQRLGEVFDLMLPEGEWPIEKKRKVARKFWKSIVGKETGLKYLAWTYQIGKDPGAKMIRIWIFDRELYLHRPRYQKNVYADESGRLCKKGTANAVLLCKKGSVIPNRKIEYFKETKTRIFDFNTIGFDNYRQYIIDTWIQALRSAAGTEVVRGRTIPRLKLNQAWNRWLRRIVIAGNRARQFIQDEINQAINYVRRSSSPEFRDWIVDQAEGRQSYGALSSPRLKLLNDLCDKYVSIFKNNAFIHDDVELHLSGVLCNEEIYVTAKMNTTEQLEYIIRMNQSVTENSCIMISNYMTRLG